MIFSKFVKSILTHWLPTFLDVKFGVWQKGAMKQGRGTFGTFKVNNLTYHARTSTAVVVEVPIC